MNNISNSDNYVEQVSFAWKDLGNKDDIFTYENNNFLKASNISRCTRWLVKENLSETKKASLKEKIRKIMNCYVKGSWINLLSENDNFIIMNKDVFLYDHSINLSCFADGIIRINQDPCVFLFRYISSKEYSSIKKNGAFKKNVIDMNCCLLLSGFFDGMLIYQHKDPLIYHIKSSKEICDAIVDKCKEVHSFLIKRQLPKICANFKNKPCYKKCKN